MDNNFYSYTQFDLKKLGKSLRFGRWLLALLLGVFATGALAVEVTTAQPTGAEASTKVDPYEEMAYPSVNYGTGAKAEQIKHGEYLVKMGDCLSCHTDPGSNKPFAGGLAIKTPFGTMYTPNITPDKATGIGTWTEKDFARALREGISKKGHYYFPAFPFPYFNKLSVQDVQDIHAYISAIPAIEQKNKPLDMPWPFRVRQLQSFWRLMFFDFNKGRFVPDPRRSEQWNRGAYLVQGLGHCAMCHSPLNPLGAVKTRYLLAGGLVDGYPAPNISASGLKNVPTEKVLAVFLQNHSFTGGQVKGPMSQVNLNSLRYISQDDLRAIDTYLRTVESQTPPAPNLGSGEKAGKRLYQNYCAGCHTAGGGGAPRFGDADAWSPILAQGIDQVYNNAIHGIGGMPAKGNCQSCTEEQIKQAVDYIVKNSGGKAGESGAPKMTPVDLTSLARGKQVYAQVCSICHDKGQLGAPKLGDVAAWQPLLSQNLDVLVQRAIDGYQGHPPKGACYHCTDADIIAAVKYMAQQSSGGEGNYKLW